MKIHGFSLLAAAMLFAVPAAAQEARDVAPNPAIRQAFEQMRTQMENVRRTERSQILEALTPQHRSLLAAIAGQLAIAVDPDYDAAAKRLNAVLSPAEAQAILRASQTAERQRRNIMESVMPPPPGGPGSGRLEYHTVSAAGPIEDAGHVLLWTMVGGGTFGPMTVMGNAMHIGP